MQWHFLCLEGGVGKPDPNRTSWCAHAVPAHLCRKTKSSEYWCFGWGRKAIGIASARSLEQGGRGSNVARGALSIGCPIAALRMQLQHVATAIALLAIRSSHCRGAAGGMPLIGLR